MSSHLSAGRRRRRVAAVTVAAVATAGVFLTAARTSSSGTVRHLRSGDIAAGPVVDWPAAGQAAFAVGDGPVRSSPGQRAVPIASVAKVMTAYVVLRDHPLAGLDAGPGIVVNAAEADLAIRDAAGGQSSVPLREGEVLTERQALQALLLPSANDVATVLARWDGGSQVAFVDRENAVARALGMRDTTYTDPSGLDPGTVSTAADQTVLARRAMALPTIIEIAAEPTATIPVVGTVATTDGLLGVDGFVGLKTGSTAAAGGCFAFESVRHGHGRRTVVVGVVLGQPAPDLIASGLRAARELVDGLPY